jgi:hypothetical protein
MSNIDQAHRLCLPQTNNDTEEKPCLTQGSAKKEAHCLLKFQETYANSIRSPKIIKNNADYSKNHGPDRQIPPRQAQKGS